MSHTTPVPVYLDCDTGIDDSLALAYLLNAPDANLVGVGTVVGNTSAEQGARNSIDLLSLAGRDSIPVAVGATRWLTRDFDGGVPHIHGDNGIGNVNLLRSTTQPVDESAADLLIRLSHEHAGELAVVTIGPLTNIALALQQDPSLPQRVKSITTMGGAALVPGNISAVAEANIGNDPEASQQVLAADWDLTLVPLDVTLENTLEEDDRQRLLNADNTLAVSVGQILDFYFDFYVGLYGRRSCALHDPLAAAIAVGGIQPTLAPAVPIEVDTTAGPGRGQTICDLRGQRLGPVDQPGARARVVLATNQPLAGHLVDTLTSASRVAAA
jgi:purine nucleosidase